MGIQTPYLVDDLRLQPIPSPTLQGAMQWPLQGNPVNQVYDIEKAQQEQNRTNQQWVCQEQKKNMSICFLSSSMCCKHAATQFKTANLGAFLLKKMIENASAGHIQEHGLNGTCCLAVYTGSKVAFLVFPFQVLPLIAIQIHPVHWSQIFREQIFTRP